MNHFEAQHLEITPEMTHPSFWGVPGWAQIFLFFMIGYAAFVYPMGYFFSHEQLVDRIIPDSITALAVATYAAITARQRTWITVGDGWILEGGTKIFRSEVTSIKERPAQRWRVLPAGLRIFKRTFWVGKAIFIPSTVPGYEQIKQELLQWHPQAEVPVVSTSA